MLGEFDLIADLFAPLASDFPGALGLQDDAAVLQPSPGRELVVTKDLMVAGVHFRDDDPADLVARKLLRVNLSDLAAMGAEGIGYMLGFAAPPEIDIEWVQKFCAGLAVDQQIFDIGLIGGDTVQTPGPLTLSVTAFGDLPSGQALKRSGARVGDLVMVSGTIGDGYLGLGPGLGSVSGSVSGFGPGPDLWSELSAEHWIYLKERLQVPEPRLALGRGLRGIAHGTADISDGLIADLGHICRASQVRAVVYADRLPLSEAAAAVVASHGADVATALLTGGDDYELVFTIGPEDRARVQDLGATIGVPIAEIGKVAEGEGVEVLDRDGQPVEIKRPGYRHF